MATTHHDPIIERATMAFIESYSDALAIGIDQPLHAAMEELLTHFAGELLAADDRCRNVRAHQVAELWFHAARQGVDL